jgi:hypothetical protein
MKRNYTLLFFLLATVSILAQTPEKMSYQVVLRDASNTLLTNQQVGIQISILQTTITGSAVYIETQTATTNINGLVSLEIGSGTSSDDFSAIDWSAGPFFIKTATDASGGSNYSIIGTSQLMSVPFALYAKTSGSSTPGPQGEPGIQGETGTVGTNGTNGAKGDTGDKGDVGDQGETGTDGTNGTNGEKGDTGDQGTQGIQGETGTAGTDGTNVIGVSGDLGNAYSDYLYWDTISNSWSVGSGEVHIGQNAGESSQGSSAVAIGRDSGIDSQGDFSVAIGTFSGYKSQGSEAVAIGYKSGTYSQGSNAVAIGNISGFSGQGDNAIAIGALSGIHQTNNSIILNATGSELNSTVSNSLYIAPIREANGPQVLTYDPITKEVTVATATTYTLNTLYPELGGYVIAVRDGGKHGLVVAMQDQGYSDWYDANDLLSDANNHDVNGAKFMDWRLPTKRELNLMYGVYIGGNGANLNSFYYWSSTERNYDFAWNQDFNDGYQYGNFKYVHTFYVRAVRAF